MTNFEKIARSEENLAKFIGEIIWCIDCPHLKECIDISPGRDKNQCQEHILNWLKQEDDYGLYNLPCK